MKRPAKREPSPEPPSARARAAAAARWDAAYRVIRRAMPGLLRRAGVVGVDLGIKRQAGRLVPGPSICIHVECKLPDAQLHPRRRFPDQIGGFPVDVVESRFRVGASCLAAGAPNRARRNPLVGGCSIGRFGETDFGTLGLVVDDSSKHRGGLTCAHVCAAGDNVRQPHRSGPSVGTVALDQLDEEIDAAFVSFNGDRPAQPSVLGAGPIASTPFEIDRATLPVPVALVGACSGKSLGMVVSVDFEGTLEYPEGPRFVRGQLRIEPSAAGSFARGGDSGGAVVRGNQAVAMLIAANQPELGGSGIATPIARVLRRLDVALP